METETWKDRLEAAISASGRSQRSISLNSGRGPGYVNSLFKEGKKPTIEKLMGVCEELKVSPMFILYGVDVAPEDAEVISAMREDPELREAILALLRRRHVRGPA